MIKSPIVCAEYSHFVSAESEMRFGNENRGSSPRRTGGHPLVQGAIATGQKSGGDESFSPPPIYGGSHHDSVWVGNKRTVG